MNELEDLAHEIEIKGKIWVEAKQIADRYDELKKVVLSEIQNSIELGNTGKELSEAKLKRIAEGSHEYRRHIEEMCEVKKTAGLAFIEYEALKNKSDAIKDSNATKRAEMKLI